MTNATELLPPIPEGLTPEQDRWLKERVASAARLVEGMIETARREVADEIEVAQRRCLPTGMDSENIARIADKVSTEVADEVGSLVDDAEHIVTALQSWAARYFAVERRIAAETVGYLEPGDVTVAVAEELGLEDGFKLLVDLHVDPYEVEATLRSAGSS